MKYTVVCKSIEHGGDAWDGVVEADSPEQAIELGCKQMDDDWGAPDAYGVCAIEGEVTVHTFKH